MNANPMEARNGCPGGAGQSPPGFEEKLQPVLREILIRLRRHQEMPLLDGIDSEGIIQGTLLIHAAGIPGLGQDWQAARAALDRLVERSLQPEPWIADCGSRIADPSIDPQSAIRNPQSGDASSTPPHPLAAWLERFHFTLEAVHPRAISILELRVDGHRDREIAQRLGLGLRLTRRIIEDMRSALSGLLTKE